MSNKLTIDEIRKMFDNVGLKLLDEESKGTNYRYTCQDEEGYLYKRTAHSSQRVLKSDKYTMNVNHTFSTKNPYFYDNMLLYIKKNDDFGTELLTEKNDILEVKTTILKFRCGVCGREFSQKWHDFVKKKDKCCNVCFNQRRSKGETNTKHIDTNKFHETTQKNGLILLDGPDIRYKKKVVVQDKEGYKGVMEPLSILRGSKFERFGKMNPFTLDNMRVFAFNHGWDCVIYNQEYKSDKHPLKLMCSCGNDFLVDMNHFVAGKYKCNECRVKQSAIAAAVELWLNQNNVLYEKEKVFKDCIYKKVLPFDFYLSNYNACIEVDGIGHYRPVNFMKDNALAQENYETRIITDKIKNDYCVNHNIPLLRLPFWEIENGQYQEMLTRFVKNLSR